MKLWTGHKWRTLSPSEAKYRRARGELVEDDDSAEPPADDDRDEAAGQNESAPAQVERSPEIPGHAELGPVAIGDQGSPTATQVPNPPEPEPELSTSDLPEIESPRAPRRCSNCGEPGHTRAKCDKTARDKGDPEIEQPEG